MSNIDALMQTAMNDLQSGKASEAVAAFEQILEVDAENGQAWYGKGCAHAELDENEKAIAAYEQSAKFAGDRAALPLFNMGNVFQRMGDHNKAAQAFHAATQVDAQMADAWINLGRILDDSGNHETAINCYDAALLSEPNDVVAHSNRGNSMRSLGRFDEAMTSYQRALTLDPQDFAAMIGKGDCLVECGQVEEGLSLLEGAARATQHPLAQFEYATALGKAKRPEAALTMFDELAKTQFQSSQLWNNRAECLAQLDRVDDAIASFDRALELDQDFQPSLFGKARVLVNAERVEDAKPLVKHLLELAGPEASESEALVALSEICGLRFAQ